MAGVLRPFHNETHAAGSVYFETVFAYFADVIKRTFRELRRRHLNPVGRESLPQLQRQPAITLSVKVRPSLDGMLLPAAQAIILSGSCPVPRLAPGVGGLGGRRRWHGSDRRVAGKEFQLFHNLGPCWQLKHSGVTQTWAHTPTPLLTAVSPWVGYLTSLCLTSLSVK